MEAGEGEEGRDCLLETQEESQRQASPARTPPPATSPQVRLPACPSGSAGCCHRAQGLALAEQPQAGSPRPASGGGPGPAWQLPAGSQETDSVSLCLCALGCVVRLLGACSRPFLAVSRSVRGQEVGLKRRAGSQRVGNFSVLLSHGTRATLTKQAPN